MLNFSPKAYNNRFSVKYLYMSVSWGLQDEKSQQIVFKKFNAILWVTIGNLSSVHVFDTNFKASTI